MRVPRRWTWLTAVPVLAAALVVGGCTSGVQTVPGQGQPAPTRALVTWVDSMCEITTSLTRSMEQFGNLGGAVSRIPELADLEVQSYLRSASSDVESMASRFAALPPSGIPGGDELVDRYLGELERVRPQVAALAPEYAIDLGDVPTAAKQDRARQVNELIGSVRPGEPDLRGLVAAEPTLAGAYELAPRCKPLNPGPLPPAADGSDVGACTDGMCQIAVSAPVAVVVKSLTLMVRIERGKVIVESGSPGDFRSRSVLDSPSGTASIGNGQDSVTIRIVAIDGDAAVLDISSS